MISAFLLTSIAMGGLVKKFSLGLTQTRTQQKLKLEDAPNGLCSKLWPHLVIDYIRALYIGVPKWDPNLGITQILDIALKRLPALGGRVEADSLRGSLLGRRAIPPTNSLLHFSHFLTFFPTRLGNSTPLLDLATTDWVRTISETLQGVPLAT